MLRVMSIVIRILAALFGLMPVRHRVVFLSRQSDKPSLDMRLLHETLKARGADYPIEYCLTLSEKAGLVQFALATIKQTWYARTSAVCIVDGYIPAVSVPKKRNGVYIIQMWHAPGAIKKFGYQTLGLPGGRTLEQAKQGCMHMRYDTIVAAGPGAVPAFAQAFNYPESAFQPVGLPRVDYLMDPAQDSARRCASQAVRQQHEELFESEDVVVLYAPTSRLIHDNRGWLAQEAKRVSAAIPEGMRVIVAGHPLEKNAPKGEGGLSERMSFIPGVATIDLLELADVVVTDYSAVAFEAVLAGRPVQFYVPDIVEYRQMVGLNVDPLAQFPDCATESVEAVLERCAKPQGNTMFTEFCSTYFEGVDFRSCDRIAGIVEARLG